LANASAEVSGGILKIIMALLSEQVAAKFNEIRASLAIHRGDAELVGVDEATGVVQVRLRGACVGCPLSPLTLQVGIESFLRKQVPGVTKVEDVTEHNMLQ